MPVSSSLKESHVIATTIASPLQTVCKMLRTSSIVHRSHISAISVPARDVQMTAIGACLLSPSHTNILM